MSVKIWLYQTTYNRLTLRKEHRFSMFENRALRRIFRPKGRSGSRLERTVRIGEDNIKMDLIGGDVDRIHLVQNRYQRQAPVNTAMSFQFQ
jgi:hypothetical protein